MSGDPVQPQFVQLNGKSGKRLKPEEVRTLLPGVTLPGGTALYPEISGSHYRCSLRFLEWTDIDSRPKQTDVDVPFTLTCCP